MNATVA